MKKPLSAILLCVMLSGLVFGAIAQLSVVHAETSILKPNVPEFTVQIVANPYDVPTTHSIDPFTGKDVTHQGYHVENRSIVVRIKNQPFTPYEIQDSKGNEWTINLHLNIRIKGSFSEVWSELYRPSDGLPRQDYESDYSVFSYVLGERDTDTYLGTIMMKFPAGGQVDFQVQAMIGYVHREVTIPVPGTGWLFTGETSGWSSTQTITIEDGASGTTPNTSSPQSPTAPTDQSGTNTMITQFGLDLTEILIYATLGIVFVSLVTVIAFMHRKIKRLKRQNESISTIGAGG